MKKRLISSVLALLLVCTTAWTAVSAASAEWQPEKQVSPVEVNNALAYQVMLKANIGTANANKPVVCRVVKKADGWTGLNDNKIVYLNQAVADAQGNVSITFVIDQYGEFEANFRVMDGDTSTAVAFKLLSKDDVSEKLDEAFAEGADTEQVLLDNQEDLNIDTTYFVKLKDNSAVLDTLKEQQNEITPFTLAKIMEEKTILEYIRTADDKLDIAKCLDAYEGKYLTLSQQQWANIYSTYQNMTDAEKIAAMTLLQSYAPATIAAVADAFNQAIIFGAVKSMDNTKLDTVITDNNDLLGLSGYEDLGTSSKADFLGILKSPSTVLNNLASVKTTYDNWKNPGNGGSGTGGTAVSGPTYANPGVGNGTAIGGVGAFGTDTDLVKGEFPETLDLATSFTDLADVEWAQTAIRYLGLLEIVNGKGDRQFCPNDTVTREEFVKMLVNAFEFYDEDATCNFADVPADHWAYSYVASAVNNGLVFGVSDTEFGAGTEITREQMATIIYRMTVKLNVIDRVESFDYQFEDMDEVSNYAKYGVLMLYNCGYIQGDNGKYYPQNTATRAESAQMIYNILVGNINKPGQTEGGSAE